MSTMTESISQLAHTIAQHRKDRAIAATRRAEEVVVRSKVVASQLSDAQSARAFQAREYRAAAAATKSDRSKEISAFLAANRHNRMTQHRHRLGEAAAQRRQLATFMSNLTDNVGAMRDGFRADLERDAKAQGSELAAFVANLSSDVGTMRTGMRAQLDAMSRSLHADLAEATRDRHAATDSWRGVKAKSPAPAAPRPQTPQPAAPVASTPVASASVANASVANASVANASVASAPAPVKAPEPVAAPTASAGTQPHQMAGHQGAHGGSSTSQPAAKPGSTDASKGGKSS